MQNFNVDDTVAALVAVRCGEREPLDWRSRTAPADAALAYTVQAGVARALGTAVGAWKVGGPLAAPPTFAPIFATDVKASPWRSAARQTPIGVECEIAFCLGRDLSPGRVHDRTSIRSAIDALVAVIELVDGRLQDFVDAPPLWKLADNQLNEGLLVGPRVAVDATCWQDARITLSIDGDRRKAVAGGNPGGDSLDLLVWLANNANGHCGGLRAGQIVTTGSYSGLDMVAPGQRVEADFGPLGSLRLDVAAED